MGLRDLLAGDSRLDVILADIRAGNGRDVARNLRRGHGNRVCRCGADADPCSFCDLVVYGERGPAKPTDRERTSGLW